MGLVFNPITGQLDETGSGSSLTLQTNGSPNGSQSLLNLVAGTNVTLTDNGSGSVTIASSGSGSTTWGTITGTLSSQTDLQAALDLKYNTSNFQNFVPSSGAILTYHIVAPGTGYNVSDSVFITGGGSGAAEIIVDSIDGGGGIIDSHLNNSSSGYTTGIPFTTTSATGIDATVEVDSIPPSATYNALFNTTGLITSDRTYTFPDEDGTLILSTDLSTYVPYTGASSDLDLGAHGYIGIGIKSADAPIGSGNSGNQFTIFSGNGDGSGSGGEIIVEAGNGGVTNAKGGDVLLQAGLPGGDADGSNIILSPSNLSGAGTINGYVKVANPANGNAFVQLDVSLTTDLRTATFQDTSGIVAYTSPGVSGSFTTVDLKTVTVVDGIITSII